MYKRSEDFEIRTVDGLPTVYDKATNTMVAGPYIGEADIRITDTERGALIYRHDPWHPRQSRETGYLPMISAAGR